MHTFLPPFPQSEDPEASALEVTHYQFLGWPDHGVPEYATALIGFIRRVRNGYNPEGPPMLVHCSAGVGRTGTFIVLDTMLERMKKEDSVNVYEVLRDMRLRRAHMVQTQASTVKPLYSGHLWDVANWLLYKGGLIIQCTFNREVLFGTLLGGCFREVTFLYRFAIWLL